MSLLETDTITAEVVAQYLRDHPDFFKDRQELVEHLALPFHQEGTLSLVGIQLKRQREKIKQLEEEIAELMAIAASNSQHFHQFISIQKEILQCNSLTQVVNVIDRFAKSLSLTAYIKLLNSKNSKYHINMENWQRFSTNHFNGKSAYLGRLKKCDRQAIFGGEYSSELESFVVLPLITKSESLGIIAFSSEDSGHFQPYMDTLFLHNFAVVVSHVASTLSWKEEQADALT